MKPSPTAWPAVNKYLADLEARLNRWPWSRRLMLAELTDGLTDAVEHYRNRGASTSRAVARALHDSGPVPSVAHVMAETLAAASARRTALTLLLTGPLVGVLWLQFLVPGQFPAALLARHPVIAVLIVVSAVCAALTVLAVGRRREPTRWTPSRIAAAACASAALGDTLLLAVGLTVLAAGPVPLGLATAAGVASLLRLSLSQRIARRDLIRSANLLDQRRDSGRPKGHPLRRNSPTSLGRVRKPGQG